MLILTRKIGEGFTAGAVSVRVVKFDTRRGQVKLGIEAPREIKIMRDDAGVIRKTFEHLETREVNKAP